jgi:membrane fusion protein (multidrug efflux system)
VGANEVPVNTNNCKFLAAYSVASIVAASVLLSSCAQGDNGAGEGGAAAKATVTSTVESAPTIMEVPVVKVEMKRLDRALDLPGELRAYLDVPMHAKVEGFVSSISVDRGSVVKRGQEMLTISCPELKEKEEEAKAKVSAAQSEMRQSEENLQSQISKQVEANARLDADSLTLSRLQQAGKVAGAIAQNDIDIQFKTVEADKARVDSLKSEIKAAQALVVAQKGNVEASQNVLQALGAMRAYLTICAPFDGVVTERNVHPGSIVAINSSRDSIPLVRVEQKSLLRLVVAVPEGCVAGLKDGATIDFSVPAFLGKTFQGKIARLGFALDNKTRTMPVELDVNNQAGELQPGMFATVHWKAVRPYDTMFVPSPAVATTLKGTFVVAFDNGKTHRVPVTKGQTMDNFVEIVGNIHPGEDVALKGTDEFKDGTEARTKPADATDLRKAMQKSGGGGE